jgi:hypothetical protein
MYVHVGMVGTIYYLVACMKQYAIYGLSKEKMHMLNHNASQNKDSTTCCCHITPYVLLCCVKIMELVLDSQGELVTPDLYKIKLLNH